MQGLFDTERRMQDGTRIQVDERYVRRSIRYPGKQIVKGYPDNMPSYDHLSDQKVNRLVAYLKRLSEQKHNGS